MKNCSILVQLGESTLKVLQDSEKYFLEIFQNIWFSKQNVCNVWENGKHLWSLSRCREENLTAHFGECWKGNKFLSFIIKFLVF